MTRDQTERRARQLFRLLGAASDAELHYRERLRKEFGLSDEIETTCALTERSSNALRAFSQSGPFLRQMSLFDKLVHLPTLANVFANIKIGDEELIVVSNGFIDLLSFHHRATIAFKMSKILSERGIAEVAGSKETRSTLYLALHDLIGHWFIEPFPLDNLPATKASPSILGEETKVFLQGLLFLLVHEEAHSILGHRRGADKGVELPVFNLVTGEEFSLRKRHELEADAWAAKHISWLPELLDWQLAAVVRLFLLIGLGHAANGQISRTHPYVSNRLASLIEVLRSAGVQVKPVIDDASIRMANEYDEWRNRKSVPMPGPEIVRTIGAFTIEAARSWIKNGGDAILVQT